MAERAARDCVSEGPAADSNYLRTSFTGLAPRLGESAVLVTERSQVRLSWPQPAVPGVVARAVCAILVDGGWVWLAPFAEYHTVMMMMIGFTTHLSPTRHLADVTPTTVQMGSGGTVV
jgi:hypothetical protein